MKKILVALVLFVLLEMPALAQLNAHPDAYLDAKGGELLTVTDLAAGGTTASKMYSGGRRVAKATFVVESNPVRCRWDGTTPTTGAAGTGLGVPIDSGQSMALYGTSKISNLKCIARGASTTAYIWVQYEYER